MGRFVVFSNTNLLVIQPRLTSILLAYQSQFPEALEIQLCTISAGLHMIHQDASFCFHKNLLSSSCVCSGWGWRKAESSSLRGNLLAKTQRPVLNLAACSILAEGAEANWIGASYWTRGKKAHQEDEVRDSRHEKHAKRGQRYRGQTWQQSSVRGFPRAGDGAPVQNVRNVPPGQATKRLPTT